jgi:hypothetical protein
MTPRIRQARFALAVFAALAVGNAYAALTTYYGEDIPSQSTESFIPPTPNLSLNAKDLFLEKLDPNSVQKEGFESFRASTTLLQNFSIFTENPPNPNLGITGTSLTGSGVVLNDTLTFPELGRFNTTPNCDTSLACNWWETSGSFTITFPSAIKAFGMYGTDWGDFGGSFSLTLDSTPSRTMVLCGQDLNVVPVGSATPIDGCGGGTINGTLSFLGFIDPTGFSSITFNIAQSSTAVSGNPDYFGFDDLVIGNLAAPTNNVPEPATLALSGLALAGLAASRRKRRA